MCDLNGCSGDTSHTQHTEGGIGLKKTNNTLLID